MVILSVKHQSFGIVMASIPRTDLIDLMTALLLDAGMAEDDSALVVDHLIFAEMSGKASHGVFRLMGIVDRLRAGKNRGKAAPSLLLDLPSLGLIDGGDRIGLVAGHAATTTAIRKARDSGIAFVGARNFGGTTGCAGYYAQMIADADLVGIVTMNSYALVSPPNSFSRVVGTNPIAIAMPGSVDDMIVDVSVASVPYGKMAILQREGKQAPADSILTKDGRPSTNPADADSGVLLPMAGHKGFALGAAMELLAGPLIGAKAGTCVKGSDGFMVICIDPARFGSIQNFKEQIQAFLSEIKNAERIDEATEIFYPGEQSCVARADAMAKATISINNQVYDELLTLKRTRAG